MVNLIFDYDGTLHNGIKIYAPAFRSAHTYLVERGFTAPKEYSDKEISYWMGFTADQMWKCFLPDLPQEEKQKCSAMIGNEMINLTDNGMAELYPQSEAVLSTLINKGFNLIFFSNCKRAYMEAHRKHFQLDRYFSAFYCSEDFGFVPKYEIFNQIKANRQGDFIIIGDRYQDMEIAIRHKLQAIGCLYGYGTSDELEHATHQIRKLSDLLHCL